MPIYAYRCTTCGHAKDVLQKMSDPRLTTCPVCGAETFVKQLTAAGFQLKGTGWYATDFKGGGAAPAVPALGSSAADKAAGDGNSAAGDKPAADKPAAPAAASPAKSDGASGTPAAT